MDGWACALQVLVYQWLDPVCESLNEEDAAAGGQAGGGAMAALALPCLGLAPSTYSSLERLLDTLAALAQQRPGGAREEEQRRSMHDHAWPDQHLPLQRRIAQDQGDRPALARALQALGLGAPWPGASASDGGAGGGEQPADARRWLTAAAAPPGLPAQQQQGGHARLAPPDVRLVTHLRPSAGQQQHFWHDFVGKCRLAWDVFFPEKQVLSPAGAMRARLQMILVSDRSVCAELAGGRRSGTQQAV